MTIEASDLEQVGLFGALPPRVLSFLAGRLVEREVGPGDVVFNETETGRELFVVLSGEMEVLKRSHSGDEARVALLGAGDWFGEMSVLDVQPRSATVRAVAASRLVGISASCLDELYREDLKSYTVLVLNVARELSRRLRVADGILADMVTSIVQRRGPAAS